jgi:prophage regulatory protein
VVIEEAARNLEVALNPDRIIRESEVRNRTGLSRTTRWRLIQRKKFPAPVSISDYAVGWRESEIQAWIEGRMRTGSIRVS